MLDDCTKSKFRIDAHGPAAAERRSALNIKYLVCSIVDLEYVFVLCLEILLVRVIIDAIENISEEVSQLTKEMTEIVSFVNIHGFLLTASLVVVW